MSDPPYMGLVDRFCSLSLSDHRDPPEPVSDKPPQLTLLVKTACKPGPDRGDDNAGNTDDSRPDLAVLQEDLAATVYGDRGDQPSTGTATLREIR